MLVIGLQILIFGASGLQIPMNVWYRVAEFIYLCVFVSLC